MFHAIYSQLSAVRCRSVAHVASIASAAASSTASVAGSAAALALLGVALSLSPEPLSAPTQPIESRYIVSFDAAIEPTDAWLHGAQNHTTLTNLPQVNWLRRTSGNGRVMTITGGVAATHDALRTLQQNPHVIALTHDAWVTPTQSTYEPPVKLPGLPGSPGFADEITLAQIAGPDDPLFIDQWHLHDDTSLAGSIDAINAWDITHGSSDTVIAVIDTGVRSEHPDLVGRLLPGYDFVSGLDVLNGIGDIPSDLLYARSNDGDGRDPDPTDPGDGVDEVTAARMTELNVACEASNSTWHGTGVASLIAANANDGVGMAGVDWNAMILPIRAIGRCGGHRSDLLDAIRWAAGVEDPVLPPNPTPAHIINLSLGMNDACSELDQAAINAAVAAGAIVVSAVGNQGRDSALFPSSPAQCQNVIGVAATDEDGYLAGYSNFGRDADISAPGGARAPSLFGVEVATNAGRLVESSTQSWKTVSGTSVSAPLVSGTLALMRSVQPNLDGQTLTRLLLTSASPFPNNPETRLGEPCNESVCGHGLLNTHHAVRTAAAHIPSGDEWPNAVFDDDSGFDFDFDAANESITTGTNVFGCSVVAHSLNAGGVVTNNSRKDPSLVFLALLAAGIILARKANQKIQSL